MQQRGTVRIYVTNMAHDKKVPEQYRTVLWRPRSRQDRAAIRRLIQHANLAAFHGEGAAVCNSFV